MHGRVGAVAAGLLTLAACGGVGAPTARAPAVRDSAGVEIVENGAGLWAEGEGWRLAAAPRLSVGALEGDTLQQLFNVTGARLLSDGTLAVANSGTSQLRFFDAAGRYRGAAGRQGDGPGEFRSLRGLDVFADTLLAADYGPQRVSLFTADGTFVRAISLGRFGGVARALGVFADGSLLTRGLGGGGTGLAWTAGVNEAVTPVHRLGLDGEIADSLGLFFEAEHYVTEINGRTASVGMPFGRVAVMGAGRGVFFYGDAGAPALQVRGLDGRLVRVIRWEQTPAPPSESDVQARVDAVPDANARRTLAGVFRDMPRPEHVPYYRDVLVDDAGGVWLQEFTNDRDAPTRWRVFDERGWLLGTVMLAARLRPYHLGRDFVVAVRRDELDVEHVEVYDLVRDGGER